MQLTPFFLVGGSCNFILERYKTSVEGFTMLLKKGAVGQNRRRRQKVYE